MIVKKCYKCKETKSLSKFYKNKNKKDGLSTYCKKCDLTYDRDWYIRNPDRDRIRKRNWSRKNMNKVLEYEKYYHLTQKIIVLQFYSDGKMCCKNCNYDENIDALTIDHINGGGNKISKQYGIERGSRIYHYIIKECFPDGLQVLCMNCQFIKRLNNDECKRPSKYL